MKKYLGQYKNSAELVLLSLGLLILLVHYFIFPIHTDAQMVILLGLVFLIGVPHGALDFLVDEQNETAEQKSFSLKKFVSVYLFRLFAFSLFWFLPWLAFSLFMIFSIYHFGETDMSSISTVKKQSLFLYLSYGTFILSILFLTHLSEISQTLPIVGGNIEETALYHFFESYRPAIIAVLAILFLLVFYYQYKKNYLRPITIIEVVQFVVLLVIISMLPLLLAFTFYFALWHSIISVRNIFSYFKSYNNNKKFTLICNKSILFSALALGGIVILYFALRYFMPDINLLFALLVILSVLTLPHLTVMHNMYLNINKNEEASIAES